MHIETISRRILSILRVYLPDYPYFALTSMLKKSLFLTNKKSKYLGEYMVSQSIILSKQDLNLFLTFDIDSLKCWEFLPKIKSLHEKLSIRSTIHILTEGSYSLDLNFLKSLEASGFEIGVHGDFHDLAFYSREYSEQVKRLNNIKRALADFNIQSFRHPGLGASKSLDAALLETGFKFDSSVGFGPIFRKQNSFQKDDLTSFLYRIPLVITDDILFREYDGTDFERFSILKNIFLDATKELNEVAINFHPMLLVERFDLYIDFLNWLKTQKGINLRCISEAGFVG